MAQHEQYRVAKSGGVGEKYLPATKYRGYSYDLGEGICTKVEIPDPAQYCKMAIPLPEKGSEDLQITLQGNKLIIRSKVSGETRTMNLPPDIHVCGLRCQSAHHKHFSFVQPFKFDKELEIHIPKAFDNFPPEGIESAITFDVAKLPRTLAVEGGNENQVEAIMPEPEKVGQEFANRAQGEKPDLRQEAPPAWSFDKMLAQYDAAITEIKLDGLRVRKDLGF